MVHLFRSLLHWPSELMLYAAVKGVYVCWSNDPANAKIKDWNVTPLKVCAP